MHSRGFFHDDTANRIPVFRLTIDPRHAPELPPPKTDSKGPARREDSHRISITKAVVLSFPSKSTEASTNALAGFPEAPGFCTKSAK
jgi:hypothetical protein